MRTSLVVASLLVSSLLVPASARAGAPGSMVLTAEQVDTGNADFEKDAKKKKVESLEKTGDQWTLYFLAFLKKAAGAKQLNVVFYDHSNKKHEPVNAFPIVTEPGAKILTSSVTFSPDQGFKPGHKYDVLVTRLVGGHEDVYARSTISLK